MMMRKLDDRSTKNALNFRRAEVRNKEENQYGA